MPPTIFLKDVKCTKCGEKTIFIHAPVRDEIDNTKTLDEYVNDIYKPISLVYRMTTYKCRSCGYSISR